MIKSPLLHGTAVLVVLFGISSAAAVTAAAELVGVDIDWPSLPVAVNTSAVSLTAAGAWLLVRAPLSPPGRAAWCAAALTIAGLVLLPHRGEAAGTAAMLLLTGAGAWLCAQVAADHGVPLWQGRPPRQIVRRRDKKSLTACVVVLAGHTAAATAEFWLEKLGPAVADQTEQASVLGLHDPVMIAAQALAAGVREEFPLLALPAVLMAAARRPVWQVLLVVCVLHILPHAYLGSPALGSAVFAATALWMYRVTHQIGPIIIGHTLFNALVLFGGLAGRLGLMVSMGAAWLLLPAVLDDASPRWLRRMFPDKFAVSGSST
ncbi:hypothetical protein ACGFJT_42060 [Actinomadura geliboluensis]|uniref:hypothetical protein n=1 Tax=Actinomadura geliboluensis TaxID=882440 RepID=UPI0037164A77